MHKDPGASLTAFAKSRGITASRMSQILKVLELADEAIAMVESLGDPLPAPIVSERRLRLLLDLPRDKQIQLTRELLGEWVAG